MTNSISPRHHQGFRFLLALALSLPLLVQAAEPLPSWNDGPSKRQIIEFVQAVTDQSSKDFVKPEDRIAVFDNDGTMWSEQPMYFELLFALDEVKRNALQHPEWKTTQPSYIVSGGDTAFMRAFAEKVYGIPPEQVIGTTFVTAFQFKDGQASILRTPKLAHNDDGPGKPESIDAVIGKRPILAFGNSDGDLQMLQWTAAGPGKRFMGLVHHTDAQREWAYDRKSDIGRLDKALDEAKNRDWTIVDMTSEWRRVYPYDVMTTE